jgi:hypothetical protein
MSGTSGKTGKAVINGSTLCATEWSLNYEGERLDGTCFTSNGLKEYVAGLLGATASVNSNEYVEVDPQTLVNVSLSNDDVTYGGSALVNTAATTPVAGILNYVYDVQFSGAIDVAA